MNFYRNKYITQFNKRIHFLHIFYCIRRYFYKNFYIYKLLSAYLLNLTYTYITYSLNLIKL